MPDNRDTGDLPEVTETGESLEGDQKSQLGDMLAQRGVEPGAGDNDGVKRTDDVDFLEGGNPGKEGRNRSEAGDQEETDDSEEFEGSFEEAEEPEAGTSESEEPEDSGQEGESGRIAQLMEQNQKLMDTVQRLLDKESKGDEGEAASGEEPARPKVEIDPASLVSEEDLQKLEDNPLEFLRDFATNIYTRAREDTINDIPALVETVSRRQMSLAEARQKFFSDYSDIAEKMQENKRVANLVRSTVNEIQSENPGWSIDKIFSEAGKEIRDLLQLDKEAEAADSKAKKKSKANNQPKPKGGKRRGGGSDNRSGLRKDLDEMLASVGA